LCYFAKLTSYLKPFRARVTSQLLLLLLLLLLLFKILIFTTENANRSSLVSTPDQWCTEDVTPSILVASCHLFSCSASSLVKLYAPSHKHWCVYEDRIVTYVNPDILRTVIHSGKWIKERRVPKLRFLLLVPSGMFIW